MGQNFTVKQITALDQLYAAAGDNTIPGTWLKDGEVTLAKLYSSLQTWITEAYAARVVGWTAPLQVAANVASLSYNPADLSVVAGALTVLDSGIDHGGLAGLGDNDHPQYLRVADVGALTVYAAGTPYALTITPALLDFGTTDPSLVISAAGTYLLRGVVRLDWNAATSVGGEVVTLKLRRTNNTPADLADTPIGIILPGVTGVNYTHLLVPLPEIVYTTANANDVIEIWGSLDIALAGGTLDAGAASLVAQRVY